MTGRMGQTWLWVADVRGFVSVFITVTRMGAVVPTWLMAAVMFRPGPVDAWVTDRHWAVAGY